MVVSSGLPGRRLRHGWGGWLRGGWRNARATERQLRQVLVHLEAVLHLALGLHEQASEALLVLLFDHAEARLVSHELRQRVLDLRGVHEQRRLARRDAAGVEPVHRPVARLCGEFLLVEAEREVVAVRDTRAVRDDDRRARIALSLEEGFHRLGVLRAPAPARGGGPGVAVSSRPPKHASPFLGSPPARAGNPRARAERRRFGLL